MELRQVEYVVGVLDHGGFTRAAAALHVSQPSLSQGIATLEAELGTALFHRLGRTVVPTAAGHAFAEPARRLLRDVKTAREAVVAVAGLEAGQLDVVTLPTLVVEPVAAVIGAFRRAHPGVTVRLFEPEDADAVLAMVRDGTCEVGAAELPAGADLVAVELGAQEVLAVCPPGTRLARRRLRIDQLAGTPLVATPPGTSTRRLVDDALAAAGITPLVAVETAHREAILPLVLAGAGTSFLPAPLAEEAARDGAVVSPLSPPLRRRIGFVHRPGPLSPAAGAFLALARHQPARS
jgi:DNA-binding transcriptional LysR family regulator